MCYKNCERENRHGECKCRKNLPCQLIYCEFCGEEIEAQYMQKHLEECEEENEDV